MNYSTAKKKIKIGYTIGDPGGIGREIFSKFYDLYKNDSRLEIILVDEKLNDLFIDNICDQIQMGKASALSGDYCYKVLKTANSMARSGQIDYLITGPVAKESLFLAGYRFSGQTELLAHLNGLSTKDIEMFFVLGNWKTVLATRHIAVKDIAQDLKERLYKVIENSLTALKGMFNIDNPKIAVAGLNPHAGEGGLIGREELEFIIPVISSFQRQGVDIAGPLAADSLFARAARQLLNSQNLDYDLYVACYHDQALPVIKGVGGFSAINLTVGLPYVRVSVDHGTGFDIVRQNIADPAGFKSCTEFCLGLLGL